MSIVNKILLEALQRGTLYHYTTKKNLFNILTDNKLNSNAFSIDYFHKPPNNPDYKIYGVSTTRDSHFHKTGNRIDDGISGDEVRIALDGNKLSEKYRITPYNYFYNNKFWKKKADQQKARPESSESEEIVVTKSGIPNIKDYILGVTLIKDSARIKKITDETLIDTLKQHNIPFKYEGQLKEGDESVYQNSSNKKFWGDMGAGVLPVCSSTGRILVGLRSQDVNEPGTWGLFGGKIDLEDGETDIQEACLREFLEETGQSSIKLIPAYVYKTKGFEYHNFIGVVSNEFEPELNWENDRADWLTLDELLKLKKKHFGLAALLKNSSSIIERYAK